MLRHRGRLRRNPSYRMRVKNVSDLICLQPLSVGTRKNVGGVFPSFSSSADSCSLAVARRHDSFLLFRALPCCFRNIAASVEYLNFSETSLNWCSGRLLRGQPKESCVQSAGGWRAL